MTGNQRGQHGVSDLRVDQEQEKWTIPDGAMSLHPSSLSSAKKSHIGSGTWEVFPFQNQLQEWSPVNHTQNLLQHSGALSMDLQ